MHTGNSHQVVVIKSPPKSELLFYINEQIIQSAAESQADVCRITSSQKHNEICLCINSGKYSRLTRDGEALHTQEMYGVDNPLVEYGHVSINGGIMGWI